MPKFASTLPDMSGVMRDSPHKPILEVSSMSEGFQKGDKVKLTVSSGYVDEAEASSHEPHPGDDAAQDRAPAAATR